MPAPGRPPASLSDGTVTLRAVGEADWPLEQALSRDPDVVRWTTIPGDLDDDQALARVRTAMSWPAAGKGTVWVVERDRAAHGVAGLAILDLRTVELFYALLPHSRGAGMAARATRLIANWAHHAGYSEIRLATFVDNIASQRTAANAGFIATGPTVRDIKGQPRDLITWQFQPARSRPTR